MKQQWDEQAILDNIRAGKQSGATYVFSQYGGRLLQFFKWKFKLSHEDAEEASQETFLRFINSVRNDKFRGDASVFTFLSDIGVNECLRIIKKKTEYEGVLINGVPIEEVVDHSKDLEKELHYRLCVAKALEEFEEKNAAECLTALTLQFEGWSLKKIAEKFGRSNGAIKTFLFECRKKVKPYLLKCWDKYN